MSDAKPTKDAAAHPLATRHLTGRRGLCTALAGMAAISRARASAPSVRSATPPPEPFPDSVVLLIGGPLGGRMEQWADVIAAALSPALPPETTLHLTLAGGADGVTAANQFEARVAPDGQTVLLLPGETLLAWLTGDPRARFDAACWLPVMTALRPGVLASRVPGTILRPGSRLLVAASVPAGPEVAAMLALDLMGIEPVPAFGLHDTETALRALRGHQIDAVFITGADAPARLAEAVAAGAAPLFTLGLVTEGGLWRDPLFPNVATALELAIALRGTPPTGALAEAWRATAAAAQLEFALVLPPLTPAALVAQWRRAGADASRTLRSAAQGIRLLCAADANAAASVAADPKAMLALRLWLAARFNWTPS